MAAPATAGLRPIWRGWPGSDPRDPPSSPGWPPTTPPPALPAYGAHGWSDAGVTFPYTVWQHHGQTTIIAEHRLKAIMKDGKFHKAP